MCDQRLLKKYIECGSTKAFGELTDRYRGLVVSTCLRQVRDHALAEDVAQSVFLLLAHKSPMIPAASLSGWLFHTSRLLAKNAVRKEGRRQRMEERMIQDARRAEEYEPSIVGALINDALDELKPDELTAILLRFYEGLTLPEVGAALGISEEAARKRVNRTLEKLRRHFGRAGIDRTPKQTRGVVRTMLTETEAVSEIDAVYSRMDRIYGSKDVEAIASLLDEIYTPDFHVVEMSGERRPASRAELIHTISQGTAARPPEKARHHEVELINLEDTRAVVVVNLRVDYLREERPVYRLSLEDRWVKIRDAWRFENSHVLSAAFSEM